MPENFFKNLAKDYLKNYGDNKVYEIKTLEHEIWKDKGWTIILQGIFIMSFLGGICAGFLSQDEKIRTVGFSAATMCLGSAVTAVQKTASGIKKNDD